MLRKNGDFWRSKGDRPSKKRDSQRPGSRSGVPVLVERWKEDKAIADDDKDRKGEIPRQVSENRPKSLATELG